MESSPGKIGTVREEYDELNIRSDTGFKKKLQPDEKILLSTVALKFNKRDKRQERTLLVTTKAIYNISRQNILTQAISWISSSLSIKRRIDITKLTGVTVSDMSGEFVLHVPDEYDYRYSSAERRDRILQMICRSYYMNIVDRPLLFYFKDQVELGEYTTTEDDKKRGFSRVPKGRGEDLDEEGMRIKSDEYRKAREKMRSETQSVFTKTIKVTLADFDLLKVLGRGAFGKVMLVEKKDDKKIYALKSLRKGEIIDKDQVEHTKTERYVLEKSNCPFLVNLEFAFQTPEKIFFVMKFMRGGELFQHLRIAKRFDENRAKFYAAEIILALEYLHSLDVAYRDLKPENILLDEEGHIALTDFGMAKRLKHDELTYSFVGTPEYLSPEMVDNAGHSFASDWWALGIFVFEMMIGLPPFYNREGNQDLMFKAIKEKEINFGSRVQISINAKDLINSLLIKDPKKRLGANGAQEIKAHSWFSDIDWKALNAKKITPPFKPRVVGELDVTNFDEEFTKEEAMNSFVSNSDMDLINKYQNEFENFSFGPTAMMRSSLLSHGRTGSGASAGMGDSLVSKGMKDSVLSTDFRDSVHSIPEEKEEEDSTKQH